MDLRRRSSSSSAAAKASDALPLPLHLTNAFFFTLFFSVAYYLLNRWRDKIRSSSPLHMLSLSDIAAVFALLASVIYLLGFFGIHFVQSFVARPADDDVEPSECSSLDKVDGQENNVITADSVTKGTAQPSPLLCTEPVKLVACGVDNGIMVDSVMKGKRVIQPSFQNVKPVLKEFASSVDRVYHDEDDVVIDSVVNGLVPSYSLESRLGDCRRAAAIRREALQRTTGRSLGGLPLEGFDYNAILGQCCEMPVGYVQVPVGVAGPLLLDGAEYTVPMATTEGCLVASTNRGCKAIYASGGATSVLLRDGMSRAPVVRFATANRAAELKFFLEDPLNFDTLAVVFNKSSRFGRLQSIKCSIAGRNVYLRFTCSTGDAMGMNMVSKGVQNVLDFLQSDFPDMDVIGISGNYCSDKKPAAVNWIEGRGKSVVCEATIKEHIVKKVLKTSVAALVELNMLKNLAGSAVAGALGGYNAHASNIVSAIFIATGQDPAQNVESSHCITMMEAVNDGRDLHVSVTMPSIEVGTVGGGTQLPSQSACLNLLGLKGASKDSPGSNSRVLATIVAGSVLAGELSLMSAIAAGQLVKSHMKYNRSSRDMSRVSS
ncbi:3-hydroxy-3-methylglutaryl-coenzyme A reductase 1 [Vigna radiata var. radiata]|uniref:3-hydroxy-3-methylglutaryl coenzyme A reductase n=1 Tax=Vigna radiata var. radiata TaxID=3916 RepID=A0A1S3VKE0_VIGRR|nr:3-hydroxy-3-methylglutaryl-coenzyme A reductase 1 [Vigna radiata var. radiata]